MTEQLNVQQMAERLCAADNILVLCHKNPDGDTIGCGSALCHALKALGKTAAVLCSDAVPSRYSFTAPVPFRGEFEPKTVVAVDVASVQLFGENNGVPQYTRHVDLCIDHHTGNSGYADFTLLDGNAAAAAELLYEVISEMGVEITPSSPTASTPASLLTPAVSGSLPPLPTPTSWLHSSFWPVRRWRS